MDPTIFTGTIPALMTPCRADRSPDFDRLVSKAEELAALGMSAFVYCGSMGDWPLLTTEQRMEGVERLVTAGLKVVVGTGALNTATAAALAAHAQRAGAQGLMVIPRLLSRGTVVAAQEAHFRAVLSAAPDLPAVIYNSPYYGYSTRADLFFRVRADHPNLVGFKEFGGNADLSYAAEAITGAEPGLKLMIGVDTAVYHGYLNCNADGAITGIGNVLPREVLHLTALCEAARKGDAEARRLAQELDSAMQVLAAVDAGPDLVLYFKHMLAVRGDAAFRLNFNPSDALTPSQQGFIEAQLAQFDAWYADWSRQPAARKFAA
ncbi:MAG: dihydrodipicolinate synthase family protein [Gemmobacter sp.]